MLEDSQYTRPGTASGPEIRLELEHRYGERVHLLASPYLSSVLARFCLAETRQPLINSLLTELYGHLLSHVIDREFPTVETEVITRMAALHPEGKFRARLLDARTRVVIVALARAGLLPSQVIFDSLNRWLDPDGVRQDHISINRKVDTREKVIGVNLGGVKIGGDVKGAVVLLPDPMGATGSTLRAAIDIYRKEVAGPARKLIAMHLIVTPEYLAAMRDHCPELSVYAIRLDRGLSPAATLKTVPGTEWAKERGLNEKQYIVPGAGGIGELLNNSYV